MSWLLSLQRSIDKEPSSGEDDLIDLPRHLWGKGRKGGRKLSDTSDGLIEQGLVRGTVDGDTKE